MSVWIHHAAVLIGLVAVLLAWLAVQRAWLRAFADEAADPDALATRGAGCGRCSCLRPCESRRARECVPEEKP